MALKGTLKDFTIADIFQMIFMGKKEGRLSVTSGGKSISVFFHEGKILHAGEGESIDAKKLKGVLLKNRYLTEKQWNRMVKECERNFQPLWILLSRYLEKNNQAFLFLRQRYIEHVFFNLLQWKKGEYEYAPEEAPPLDKEVFRPIEGEFLLMEGYRLIDEWKRLESNLPLMETIIFTSPEYKKIVAENGILIGDKEEYILSLIEQPISLGELIDSSQMSICETGRSVERLIASGLLTTLANKKIPELWNNKTHKRRNPSVIGSILFLVFLGIIIRTTYLDTELPSNQLVKTYKEVLAKETMNNMVKSLKFYTSLKGKFPDNINSLVEGGYLSKEETMDPWGRPFILEKDGQFFTLFSQGPSPDDPGDDLYFYVGN